MIYSTLSNDKKTNDTKQILELLNDLIPKMIENPNNSQITIHSTKLKSKAIHIRITSHFETEESFVYNGD